MSVHAEGVFSGHDGARLFWQRDLPEEPRADLILLHGYGDHLGRYRAFREAMVADRFAVHAFDQRGHGRTEGPRGAVKAFEDYRDDLRRFILQVRAEAGTRKTFLVAHSFGALVALSTLERTPQPVAGLIATNPYLALGFKPPAWKTALAGLLARFAPDLGIPNGLSVEGLSRDEGWQKATKADPLYSFVATGRWYVEHRRAQDEVVGAAGAVTLPILMLLGTEDRIASPELARQFFAKLRSTDKTLRECAGMRHELLAELGKEELFAEISRWISEHL